MESIENKGEGGEQEQKPMTTMEVYEAVAKGTLSPSEGAKILVENEQERSLLGRIRKTLAGLWHG